MAECHCPQCYDPDPVDNLRNELGRELRNVWSRLSDLEELVEQINEDKPTPPPLHIKVDCNHKCNPSGGTAEIRWPYAGTHTGTDSTTP